MFLWLFNHALSFEIFLWLTYLYKVFGSVLENKLVVVTGSNSGIGKRIAKSFLQEGAKVIINGRSQSRVDETVNDLSAFGSVYGIAADVTDASQTQEFLLKV